MPKYFKEIWKEKSQNFMYIHMGPSVNVVVFLIFWKEKFFSVPFTLRKPQKLCDPPEMDYLIYK